MEPIERPNLLRGAARLLRRGGKRDAEAELTVAASVGAVWSLISDVERIADWWPRAVSGVIVSGEEVGRTQVVTFDWGRRRGVVRQRVTGWEPPYRYAWRVTEERYGDRTLPRAVDVQVSIEVAARGPLAHVKIHADYVPISPRGGFAIRQMSRLARSTFRLALKHVDVRLSEPPHH